MATNSHRLRAEEKKLYRKLIYTALFILAGLILFISAGLPLFAKIIVTLSSFRKESPSKNNTSYTILFPPVLEVNFEATNSARITVSGIADKEATVAISVNDRAAVKVTADSEGKFRAPNIILTEGTNNITAQTIKGEQESSPSSVFSVIYKKTPPKLEITAPSENQKFSGDAKDITISGTTDAGSRITINDRLVIVDQDGKFSYPVTLSEGENTFKFVAVDIAGNQTTLERKVTFAQ